MTNICITAIDTDAGKSCVSAAICDGFGYEYFKLIQAGAKTDENVVKHLSPNIKTHPCGIMLQTAASPHVGMALENIDYDGLKIKIPKEENILIELAGGLFCPLDKNAFMIDFISTHKLKTFLVVRDYLGSINHTILSLNALKNYSIDLLGIIISGKRDKFSDEYLEQKFPNINIFFLDDIKDFKKASRGLKEQLLKSNLSNLFS